MTNDNGQQAAFPVLAFENGCSESYVPGLTKREYFAARAMQGLLANAEDRYPFVITDVNDQKYILEDTLAKEAVSIADALLNRLSKPFMEDKNNNV